MNAHSSDLASVTPAIQPIQVDFLFEYQRQGARTLCPIEKKHLFSGPNKTPPGKEHTTQDNREYEQAKSVRALSPSEVCKVDTRCVQEQLVRKRTGSDRYPRGKKDLQKFLNVLNLRQSTR